MEGDVANLAGNAQQALLEGLHSAAYAGGLGRPLIVPQGCLGALNAGGWLHRLGGLAGVQHAAPS